MITVKEIVENYMNDAKAGIIENYLKDNMKASGRFERELNNVITENGNNIRAEMTAPFYAEFMQNGRPPNKDQSQEALVSSARYLGATVIKDWAAQKGIQINPYAVAWKIVTEGTKVPNERNPGTFITNVVNDDWLERLSSAIGKSKINEVTSDIIKQWQQ